MNNDDSAAMQFKDIHQICIDFLEKHGTNVICDQDLAEFLKESKNVDLSQTQKLLFLSGSMAGAGNWENISHVYRYAIKGDPSRAESVYGAWAVHAVSIIQNTKQFDDTTRIKVARDLQNLLSTASKEFDFDMPFIEGLLYYFHPTRAQYEQQYLQKAVMAFQKAVEQKTADDELDADTICYLANAYYELGDKESANKWYRRIDVAQLSGSEGINEALVAKRIQETDSA